MFFFGTAFDTETGFSLNLEGKLMLSVSVIFLIVALDLISTVRVIFFARRRGIFFFANFSSQTGLKGRVSNVHGLVIWFTGVPPFYRFGVSTVRFTDVIIIDLREHQAGISMIETVRKNFEGVTKIQLNKAITA